MEVGQAYPASVRTSWNPGEGQEPSSLPQPPVPLILQISGVSNILHVAVNTTRLPEPSEQFEEPGG